MPDIAKTKVSESDLQKLHSEVNQIVTQRFSLTTLAVIVFATICGWASSSFGKDKPITAGFVTLVDVLILCSLLVIFLYFVLLLGQMRIFTVYIIEKYQSPWETDWQEYRKLDGSNEYWGYSKAGRLIFQTLGILSTGFLFILWRIGQESMFPIPHIFWYPLVGLFLYIIVVQLVTKYRHKLLNESKISDDWKRALSSADALRNTKSIDTQND